MSIIRNMLELYFSPSGRINRKTFTWSCLFLTLIQIGIAYLIENSVASSLIMLPVMYCSIILCIKRFHDLNKSGWFYLCLLIPVVGLYFLALLAFKKGTSGDNPYGPDPLVKNKKAGKPVKSQYPEKSHKDVISSSADSNPVYLNTSSGFGRKLIIGVVVLLIITGAIISLQNTDSSHQDLQKELSKNSFDSNRDLSSSITEDKGPEDTSDTPPSRFIFKVLNIDNDEVTVQFERDIPMNIKFFGVSKDLARKAEILSRENQRQAIIFLNSASLLQVGRKYYGYLVNYSEQESISP